MNKLKLETITAINSDCMDYMRSLPDKAFDLAIVDPPYGLDIAKSGNVGGGKLAKPKDYGKKEWDFESPNNDYFIELIRVSKHQIIFGANHFITKIGLDSPCWIVWDKQNTGNFADCELAWTSFNTAVRKFTWMWNGRLQEDMKNKQKRIHPTEKPIKLYEWLLTNYAKQGDKILDTHGGSMSHAIACHNLGFELTIIEKDEDYFNQAINRLKWHQRQQVLQFDEY